MEEKRYKDRQYVRSSFAKNTSLIVYHRRKNAKNKARGATERQKRYTDSPPPSLRPRDSFPTAHRECRDCNASSADPTVELQVAPTSETARLAIPGSVLCFEAGTLLTSTQIEAVTRLSEQVGNWVKSFGLESVYWRPNCIEDAFVQGDLDRSWRKIYSGDLHEYLSICALRKTITSALSIALNLEGSFERLLGEGTWTPEQRALLLAEFRHFSWVCNTWNMKRCGLDNIVRIWRTSGSPAVAKALTQVRFPCILSIQG